MISRSPAERYFKYLIVHPDAYSNEDIKKVAFELELDYLGDWYVVGLREKLSPPKPFFPASSTHTPSVRFLAQERITRAFHPNAAMRSALKIACRPRVREMVEVMMISGAPDSAITFGLQKRLRFSATVEALELYRHYFWDLQLLDTSSLQALLFLRHERVVDSQDPEIKGQFNALRKGIHKDPRLAAAKLPATPLAGLLSQLRMGIMPRRADLTALVEETRAIALLRAWETSALNGDSGAALNWAMTSKILTELLESVVNPEEQLRENLQRVKLATSATKVPSLRELTNGEHTTTLQPEPHSKEDAK